MSDSPKRCVVTGATGYVGGRLNAALMAGQWQVAPWSRRGGEGHVRFELGQDVDARGLENCEALVHCAHDFAPRRWEDIEAVNVRGSKKLFRAARAAGVRHLVFISSASAFEGCRSLYGRAKLQIEAHARAAGAVVIRPGLVYGPDAGGVFGNLVAQVRQSRAIPLIGGSQPQHLVHEADLGALVCRAVTGAIAAATGPIECAHEEPWTLRRLLEGIAEALGRNPVLVPVPWRAAWLGLRALELLGLPVPFRSDSLLGLMHPNPHPSFVAAQALGIHCRQFTPAAVLSS